MALSFFRATSKSLATSSLIDQSCTLNCGSVGATSAAMADRLTLVMAAMVSAFMVLDKVIVVTFVSRCCMYFVFTVVLSAVLNLAQFQLLDSVIRRACGQCHIGQRWVLRGRRRHAGTI